MINAQQAPPGYYDHMILSPRWQSYYMNLARNVALGSKDGSSKVGAILVRPDKTLASIGFNGFPKRIRDVPELLNDPANRARKYPRMVHAEVNALDYNRDVGTDGYHLIVSMHPCSPCALRIASSGIQYVYYETSEDYETRWHESVAEAREILDDAGVRIVRVHPDP